MLGKLFGGSKEPAGEFVIARLNARVQPLDRGDIYEDPLDDQLKERTLGEVTRGGTQLGDEGEIQFCDLEICLDAVSDEALDAVRTCLESLGAPKGSALIVEADQREIPFGSNEGLAVYLNGTDLPDKVYEECDFDVVWNEFETRLGANGKVHSHWQGPTETALYLYGPSYETMLASIQDFLDSYPLCQKARVEKVA